MNTYHIFSLQRRIEFYPLIASQRLDIYTAYLTLYQEKPEYITTSKLRESLGMVIESIDNKTYSRETIKNHLIEIKKQLRG